MNSILKRLEQLEKRSPDKRAIKAFLCVDDSKTDEEAIAEYKQLHPDKAADVFVVYRRGNVAAYSTDLSPVDLKPDANMPKLSEEDMEKAKEWLEGKL